MIVTRRLPEAVEKRLTELFDVTLREEDTPLSRADLVAAVHEADVLVPTITDTIDAGLLAQAGPGLKLIANFGAGVDHIDMATCATAWHSCGQYTRRSNGRHGRYGHGADYGRDPAHPRGPCADRIR